MASFPSLDIREAYIEYDEFTIGAARRDLWNGALTLAYYDGIMEPGMPDVIGINHDVDVNYISPHYIKRIQQYYKKRQCNAESVGLPNAQLRPIGTRVSHAVLPSHPNIGKVTRWIDNTYFQQPGHGNYEAGMVIPFSHYTSLGGFNAADSTHETRWVSDGIPVKQLIGAQLQTSPRRYIDRLEEHGTAGIWLPGTFGAKDACRDQLKPDITHETAEDIILKKLEIDIRESWMYGALYNTFEAIRYADLDTLKSDTFQKEINAQAEVIASKQLAKAVRFLRKIVRSDILADILETGFDAPDYAQDRIQSLTFLRQAFGDSYDADEISISLF